MADAAGIDRFADGLRAASYDVESVQSLLGPMAYAALGRDDPIPALRAATGGSALETLVRLFLLGSAEPIAAVRAALPMDALPEAFVVDGSLVRSGLDIRPYEQWWVVSDVGTPSGPDHVLGVGGASVTLARATVPVDVPVAADIGTGSGVQALHLSSHASQVIATDVNTRALRLAALTARLNGVEWDLRAGDLLAPLGSDRVDLVVSNPPFVVGPGRSAYTYRDSGLVGDAVCAQLVSSVSGVLSDGGWCQLLANWLHTDEPWQERVAAWLPDDCDAWVVQREVQDPAEYVALWLADADEGAGAYDEWLSWFESAGVSAVGFGLITLRRGGGSVRRIEELRQPVDDGLGPHVLGWFGRQEALAGDLSALRLRRADGVVLDRTLDAGPSGWQVVVTQRLRQVDGLRRSAAVDDVAAALVAGCDGTRSVGDLLAVLAMAYGVPLPELTQQADPVLRGLITDGYLEPAWTAEWSVGAACRA